ncbi:MAG TPA: PEGA domain-containing protein [Clostridiales bacterium]|nr:PEGA domain-containing protein [Clostridiales bacterium]
MDNYEDIKRKRKITRPIVTLLIGLSFISIILLTMMLGFSPNKAPNKKSNGAEPIQDKQPGSEYGYYDTEALAIVMDYDTTLKKITLLTTEAEEPITLFYSGGTDIKDKFGQIITAAQVSIGSMVDIGYIKNSSKLIKIHESSMTWENVGVSNLTIDPLSMVMKIGTSNYKFNDNIVVVDGKDLVSVEKLAEQDVLIVRGYEDTIYSITILKGHGTVRLVDIAGFSGGNVTVGYEAMQKVSENLVIPVREGNFNITVENGKYSVTKNIEIIRNEETIVSFDGLGQMAEENGMITFDINPFGADLFIDGMLTLYANPVKLAYGEHDITVSLGGYTTYEGYLKVNEDKKTVKIDLPEATSSEEADVTIIDSVTEDISTPTWANDDDIDHDHFIYVENPMDASVYMNGEFMGTSPIGFEKIIGSHVFTFIRDGYETISYTIDIEDDNMDTYISMPDLIPE